MSDLTTADLVDVDLPAGTREDATRLLAARMAAAGRVTDLEGFLADVAAREAQTPTGLDGGIGIPHARSAHVDAPALAFGRAPHGVDFGADDGPADLVFLIAVPAGGDTDHLAILSALARRLTDEAFSTALRAETDPARAAALVRGDSPAPADPAAGPDPAGTPPAAADTPGPRPLRIVAVTSCPTGIAHTYMAAEALQAAGRDAGAEVTVEPQGSAGFTRLDPAAVAAADGVILAHDVEVRERSRFAGKPTVDVGVKAAVNRPAELIAEVRRKAGTGGSGPAVEQPAGPAADGGGGLAENPATRLRTWLMTGVSHMVPFVAAGGLLIALSFAIGGYHVTDAPSVAKHFDWSEAHSWAALLNQIGNAAFAFLVPVLAGFIAYGMADRPGLVPGFVGGSIALTIDAGFLGGLAAGLLAGAVVAAIRRIRVPAPLRGIMPVVVIPLVSAAVVGALMYVVVGKPIAALQRALTDWLSSLSGTNAVVLGAVLGLMMCFDMGGPLNKVAYAFAVGGLSTPNSGSLRVMAAVMAAGMVPPLAMALATTVRGRLFDRAERENGKAAWVLGISFISEGAIPFAAADPLRVIPSAMAGGAATGALSMAFGCTLRAPHGGVFVVPLIGSPLLYLAAVAAGTALAALLVVVLKDLGGKRPEPAAHAGRTVQQDADAPAAARRALTPRPHLVPCPGPGERTDGGEPMETTVSHLLDRARRLAGPGGRRLLGIAGPPGAGKSTLAARLADDLGASAVRVPMDGFHLADAELRRLGRTERKGAPDTFDAHGYAALLRRLRSPDAEAVVYAPAFDRELDQPVAGSIPVAPDVPLVITEGNYLLLDREPWRRVRSLLDEVWWIEADPGERVRRLVERHRRHGRPRPLAERFVRESDEANAALVEADGARADLVVRYPAGGAPPPAGRGV